MSFGPHVPSAAEIARYLRMGRNVPEGALADRVGSLLPAAVDAMHPRRVWRRMARERTAFVSSCLDRRLVGCADVYLLCTTLGAGFDALMRRRSVASGADAFIIQAIGAAAVEKFTDCCEDEIRRELAADEELVERYSPGYGDFPMTANGRIAELLDAARTIGVSVAESSTLLPTKTVTAVIGVKGHLNEGELK